MDDTSPFRGILRLKDEVETFLYHDGYSFWRVFTYDGNSHIFLMDMDKQLHENNKQLFDRTLRTIEERGY